VRALVTGAAGFVGGWMVEALVRRGDEVHGLALPPAPDTVAPGGMRQPHHWHHGDVRDAAVLAAALEASRPDAVFHLAGVSSVGGAASDPGLAADINVTATVRLLAAVARLRTDGIADPVVLVVGSGEQYGVHPIERQPLPESTEQRPLTLYAATKAAQELFARQAWRRDGVRVVCARSFNHSGAGQSETFLLPALVRRALRLREQGGGQLRLGNTTPIRDVSHVSDVVAAYILLAERGEAGEAYNVCRGAGWTVGELAAAVLRRVGVDAPLAEDPALVRPVDVPALVGDATRLRALGWAPAHTLDDCIDDLIHAATH